VEVVEVGLLFVLMYCAMPNKGAKAFLYTWHFFLGAAMSITEIG
jgi:hypothetical protein